MKDIKQQLLDAVAPAVARYGISGVSTRNIAALAGVSDSNIYRFFGTVDDLLLASYKQSSWKLVENLIVRTDELHLQQTEKHLKECVHLLLADLWNSLMADPELCLFHVYYYHSLAFDRVGKDFHQQEVDALSDHLQWLFDSRTEADSCLEILFNMVYSGVKYAAENPQIDQDELREKTFRDAYGYLFSKSNRWPFKD